MTTHTPGPWRIGDAGHTVFGPPNGRPAPEIIAQRCGTANARLIAAAPALLAALEGIMSGLTHGAHIGCDCSECRAARAALRAALGDTPVRAQEAPEQASRQERAR